MKKTLIPLMVVICCIAMTTYGQILNPGFENWTSGNPDNWATSNAFPAGLVNVTQTSDCHSGLSAVRGEVINFLGSPMGPLIQSGTMATGFPISEQYHTFGLYYKFTPVGGDKFSVNVALYKAGSAVAQGVVALPATVGSYTYLAVPLTYTTSDVPDLAIIQLSVTGPATGQDVHIGSVMFVDDLAFSISNGTGNTLRSDPVVKCYPNPSGDIVNISLNETVSGDIAISVFDPDGKKVKTTFCHSLQPGNNRIQISVEDLVPGLYFYYVTGQNIHDNGKFLVSR
jgi:hypothetical protein